MEFDNFISFNWDKGNIDKNSAKHGVEKDECEQVFFDRPFFLNDEKHSQIEDRYTVYGESGQGRRLTLIFTLRKSEIRVISARDQSKKEKYIYLKSIKQ